MEEVFAIGNKVWRFIETAMDPATYFAIIDAGSWVWAVGAFLLLVPILIIKNRRARSERSQRLEELEQALLDEDVEDKSLNLPEGSALDEEFPDPEADEDEEYDWDRPLQSDPVFGNRIVISADSSRKQRETEPQVEEPDFDQDESDGEIEREFAKLEDELRQKELEVRRRHQIGEQQREEAEQAATTEPPAPFELSEEDLLSDQEEEVFHDELDDLLNEPLVAGLEEDDEPSPASDLQQEMEQTIAELSQGIEDPAEAAWGTAAVTSTPEQLAQEKQENLISQLQEFQKDLEHRFQTHTLETLAERNHQLVETLDHPEDKEYRQAAEENKNSLAALEILMAGDRVRK